MVFLDAIFEGKTKWITFTTYNQNGNDFIVFVRRGLKSGMLYFKTIKVSPMASCSYMFEKPHDYIVDMKQQFEKITSKDFGHGTSKDF